MEMSHIEVLEALGFDTCTHYQFVHFIDMNRGYDEILPDVLDEWKHVRESIKTEYYPHVAVGWDNNPRHFRYSGLR